VRTVLSAKGCLKTASRKFGNACGRVAGEANFQGAEVFQAVEVSEEARAVDREGALAVRLGEAEGSEVLAVAAEEASADAVGLADLAQTGFEAASSTTIATRCLTRALFLSRESSSPNSNTFRTTLV
jgi:hypothetical protein